MLKVGQLVKVIEKEKEFMPGDPRNSRPDGIWFPVNYNMKELLVLGFSISPGLGINKKMLTIEFLEIASQTKLCYLTFNLNPEADFEILQDA